MSSKNLTRRPVKAVYFGWHINGYEIGCGDMWFYDVQCSDDR